MYLPVATLPAVMAKEELDDDALKLSPEVMSSTASSIVIKWSWEGLRPVYVRGFRVHYQRLASTYGQQSPFLPPSVDSYGISNLVADTYYKVCVTMFRNDTSAPLKECVEAATTSWHIPVSIGSSIGAVLALSIIVLIVMLSRCPNLVRTPRTAAAESSKYDSMSSHYPDDRYEMSDTTTHYHDHEGDEDVFSQHSEGDSLADSKTSRHSQHHSPQSLADRLCNGTRGINGVGKHIRAPVPVHRVERTLSLTDKRHPPSHPYRMRQARLAHLHANFHSIQSEPGSIPARSAPRVSITDFTPPNSSDLASTRKSHHSSLPVTHFSSGKGTPPHIISCPYQKPIGRRENPRLMYRIDSATSNSEPSMSASNRNETKARPQGLKNLPKTIHMSIDGDALL